jgi:hypothetical protein
MPLREWISYYEGNEIRVVNTWFQGAKLFINGEVRDEVKNLFSLDSKRPLLSARIEGNQPTSPLVEVYMKAIFTVRVKIHVNGRFFSGEKI